MSLQLPADATVRDLKEALSKKFSGKPPADLQRLFSGSTLLTDDTTLEEARKV
jgi:Ubiquitin family